MESTYARYQVWGLGHKMNFYLSLSLGDVDVVVDVIGSSALGTEATLADPIT